MNKRAIRPSGNSRVPQSLLGAPIMQSHRMIGHSRRVPHPSQFHRDGWERTGPWSRTLFASILLAAAFLCPTHTRAQGCTQCRDNTAATTPATQRAYRHAIVLMVAASGGIFLGTLVLLKRHSSDK